MSLFLQRLDPANEPGERFPVMGFGSEGSNSVVTWLPGLACLEKAPSALRGVSDADELSDSSVDMFGRIIRQLSLSGKCAVFCL